MINKNIREAQYFFYSQAFADGLRASFAIILPALLGSYFGYFELGLTVALGAMCVSLTDAPGPVTHKRNGMLASAGFAFLLAFITAQCSTNNVLLAIEIVVVTFFFSMLSVYGSRASAVGNTAILVMILTMDDPAGARDNIFQPLLILAGGLFYFCLSMMLHFLRPYRNAQRALGDCIRKVAEYLDARAAFYDVTTDLDSNYRRLISLQVAVNEKQDAVRELFFKTRQIVEESTHEGRRLVFTFVETVDLFETVTASYYDYRLLREKFGNTGALEVIHISLKKIVYELDRVGFAIQTNTAFVPSFNYDEEIRQLKAMIDNTPVSSEDSKLVLKKIVVNIRRLLTGLHNISQYFDRGLRRKKSNLDHSHFVSHQVLDPAIFKNNLSLQSSVFRHSVRVSLACLVGFALSRIIAYGDHSYWILLTIAFILKPAFSLTKQRNIQRIIGTLGGGVIGILILVLIRDTTVHFIFMVLFMIGTYSFLRINYLLMVICTTPYVLILFSLFGFLVADVARERLVDTLIGCAIALSASYFLFPKWESEELRNYMKGILKANAGYMRKILEALSGQQVSMLEYKLARKEVYLNSANLSAAFQRMLSEPKNKQGPAKQLHQFLVLNHILFSNIATVATTLIAKGPSKYPDELVQLAKKSEAKLAESLRHFEGDQSEKIELKPVKSGSYEGDEALMEEQLRFIYRVSSDIDRTVKMDFKLKSQE